MQPPLRCLAPTHPARAPNLVCLVIVCCDVTVPCRAVQMALLYALCEWRVNECPALKETMRWTVSSSSTALGRHGTARAGPVTATARAGPVTAQRGRVGLGRGGVGWVRRRAGVGRGRPRLFQVSMAGVCGWECGMYGAEQRPGGAACLAQGAVSRCAGSLLGPLHTQVTERASGGARHCTPPFAMGERPVAAITVRLCTTLPCCVPCAMLRNAAVET